MLYVVLCTHLNLYDFCNILKNVFVHSLQWRLMGSKTLDFILLSLDTTEFYMDKTTLINCFASKYCLQKVSHTGWNGMRMIKLWQCSFFRKKLPNRCTCNKCCYKSIWLHTNREDLLTACLRIREYAKTKAVLYSNTAKIIPVWPFPLMSKFQGL